jgi:hypothetical protein
MNLTPQLNEVCNSVESQKLTSSVCINGGLLVVCCRAENRVGFSLELGQYSGGAAGVIPMSEAMAEESPYFG